MPKAVQESIAPNGEHNLWVATAAPNVPSLLALSVDGSRVNGVRAYLDAFRVRKLLMRVSIPEDEDVELCYIASQQNENTRLHREPTTLASLLARQSELDPIITGSPL